jgi:Bacterial HORMA domain family 1
MPSTHTATQTYTTADVERVFRRFRADIIMIADSTGALTRSKAEDYAHDAEYLAVRGYLEKVDVTLLSNGIEQRAAVYRPNEQPGNGASARPGGVLWPTVPNPSLRVLIGYTKAYTPEVKTQTQRHLKISWISSNVDASHASLSKTGSRSYSSNGYGLDREDLT